MSDVNRQYLQGQWRVNASAYDQLLADFAALRYAAQQVILRWDTPLWKEAPATAIYINALRVAAAPSTDGSQSAKEGE